MFDVFAFGNFLNSDIGYQGAREVKVQNFFFLFIQRISNLQMICSYFCF